MATTEIRRAETNLLLTELSLKADVADTVIVRECTGRRFIEADTVIATKIGRTVHGVDFLLTEASFVSFSALAYKSLLDLIVDTNTVVLARVRRAMIDRKRRVVT